jgi:hypothetical protein
VAVAYGSIIAINTPTIISAATNRRIPHPM